MFLFRKYLRNENVFQTKVKLFQFFKTFFFSKKGQKQKFFRVARMGHYTGHGERSHEGNGFPVYSNSYYLKQRKPNACRSQRYNKEDTLFINNVVVLLFCFFFIYALCVFYVEFCLRLFTLVYLPFVLCLLRY